MTKIPLEMFSGCSSLTSVSIPNTVTEIDGYAFDGCESLETLILPTSLKKIAGGIISKTNIKELVIPYGAEEILGNGVSTYTNSLTAVYVPDTVTQISRILLECPNAIVYCTENSATAKNCKKNNISYLTDKSVNSSITVYYNGTRVSFHTYDQNPELINNRTLVPLRAIFEAMNAEVNWDQDTQTVTATRNNSTITLKIGSSELNKDGQSIPVDVPAQIINSRTMVPVRVIAEAFGADVQWNASGKTILINE
jgi:hypothetical protein